MASFFKYVKPAGAPLIFFLFAALLAGTTPFAQDFPGTAPILPSFTLNDPAGEAHSSLSLLSHGVIFVVTAPILSNKKEQEGWDKFLTPEVSKDRVRLIFLEDMSPSFFRGIAFKRLKKEFRPGSEPLILIDPKGDVRKSLGVKRKATVILAYNRKGRLIHVEEGQPSPEAAQRIRQALGVGKANP